MTDLIMIIILLVIIVPAIAYIVKSKKSGAKCIGCSPSGGCSSGGGAHSGCGCHTDGDAKSHCSCGCENGTK